MIVTHPSLPPSVPDAPVNVIITPVSTKYLMASWDAAIQATLRGHLEHAAYLIDVNGIQEVVTNQTTYILGPDELQAPGSRYEFEVCVCVCDSKSIYPPFVPSLQIFTSNGVLTSIATVVNASTWSLPPAPVVMEFSNVTIVVSLTLTVPDIQTIYAQVCVCIY